MKFSLGWLKDHLETSASLADITGALDRIGLEVEGVEDLGAALAPFRTARVLEAEPHPDADRLRVCKVEHADGVETVVCGAPNARAGMVGVFAPSGSTIPGNGLVLKPTKIRGVPSNGMLVSQREMGLSDEHDGIIELPADTPVGVPMVDAMALNDPVIDIAITPNRPDALGVRGIARDLAAAELGSLLPFEGFRRYRAPIRTRGRSRSISPETSPRVSHSRAAPSGASPMVSRRPGCRPVCAPWACAPSTRWPTSPIT